MLSLAELVDVDCESALKVRCLVLVDYANLCKLVNHCEDLRSSFLRSRIAFLVDFA